jgi:hypothetical protein
MTRTGQDLPDADGFWFLALNGGFRAKIRSLIGQLRTVSATNCPPQSGRRMLAPNHWERNVPDISNCNKFDVRKRREMRAPLGNYTRLQSHIWCVMTSFQLVGLPFEKFASLFALSDSALAEGNVRRVVATSKPGYPCRVSLADAEIGEELLLLSFEHQPARSPYRSSGPIYVRKAAVQANVEPGMIPDYIRLRLMSVRAYDSSHLMTDAIVCAGHDAASAIQKLFSSNEVAYIHLHNANRGCFSCAVNRV